MNKIKSNYELVYEIVRFIPKGRVTTYGAISNCISGLVNARMVGYAMSMSHQVDPDLPAHRVVNRLGELTGRMHFSSHTEMQELLESEGIIVIDNKIVSFGSIFWDPKEIIENL